MSGVPVIAIDGPSASGKGTMAARLAATLGFQHLDSGALYRLAALWGAYHGLTAASPAADFAPWARHLPVVFDGEQVLLDRQDVTDAIRTEACGLEASRISAHPELREALLQRQRDFRMAPGLVADGRDMGSVVFPDACLKVFLTASLEERTKRRFNQLIAKGNHVIMEDIFRDLFQRDERDRTREVAPLDARGYRLLDTTALSPDQVVEILLVWSRQALG